MGNWMNLKELNRLKNVSNAHDRFLEHVKFGPAWESFGLRLLFIASFIPGIRSLPFIKTICMSTQKLLRGYGSESDLNFGLQETSPKLTRNENHVSDMFDFIVVGSGPGAAISCLNIPKDAKVLIIEKSGFPKTPAKFHHTLAHVLYDFEKAGKEIIFARSFPQFAQGSVVGGGSEVNSGLYHRLPDNKLNEYLLAAQLSDSEWNESQIRIEDLLHIQSMDVDERYSLIANSARALDLEYMNVPRWRRYHADGSFEHFGMIEVAWKSLSEKPNCNLVINSIVKRIDNSHKDFIEVRCINEFGGSVSYNAKQVIVSAGTISTPFLLAKSRLIEWRNIDFQWHPMIRKIVTTNPEFLGREDIDPFQSWTEDFRFKFGSAVSTRGLLGVGLNKLVEESDFQFLRSYYVSFVSSGRGGLIPMTQRPWYQFSEQDRLNIEAASSLLTSFLEISGARIFDMMKTSLSTVHIFGSLPIGSRIFIPGTNRLTADSRIMVADASLLPIGPSVNPQGPLMTLVDSLSRRDLS